jgi:phage tail P2-like protein
MLVAIGYGTSPVDFGYFQPSFGFSWPLEAIDLVTGPPETTPAGFIGTVPNEVQFSAGGPYSPGGNYFYGGIVLSTGSPEFSTPICAMVWGTNLIGTDDPINEGILPNPGSELIFRQATGLEKAMADVDTLRLIGTYAELVRDQWDPYAINYRNLGYLAWAMGVNLWEDDWDETFRRWWVADQWTFKAQRGSLSGIEMAVSAVAENLTTCPYGAEVLNAITPPATFFAGASETDAQRAAYNALFPQLRVYPYVARAILPYSCFCGNWPVIESTPPINVFNDNGCFLGPLRKFYPTNSDAGGRYTRTAEYWDKGVLTPLTIRTITDVYSTYGATIYDQVTLPSTQDDHWYLGQSGKYPLPAGHQYNQNPYAIFLGAHDETAAQQILIPRDGTLSLATAQAQYTTILPSMEMINVVPNQVAEVNPYYSSQLFGGVQGQNTGQFLTGKFLPTSTAWQYMYEQWFIFDPSIVPPQRVSSVYMGHARLGIPAYTAELAIAAYGQSTPWVLKTGGYMYGYLKPSDSFMVDKVLRAVRASMALRDTIGINTAIQRVISTNDSLAIDGGFSVGQYIEDYS